MGWFSHRLIRAVRGSFDVLELGGIAVAAVDLSGVTADAAEINKLDGLTTTKAELEAIAGAGVLAASYVKLQAITATAAELNKNGGVTAGVALASKVAVLGTSKELSGIYRPVLSKGANYPVVAADANSIMLITAANLVITLPSTIAGFEITFVLTAAALSAGTGLSISPAAADKIMGQGLAGADNKDIILAGSGDRSGDSVTLVGDGSDGWFITHHEGTWTQEG